MPWSGFLAVGIGAAIGAWLRWLLGVLLNPLFPTLPLGTLSANLAGGLLMGFAMELLTRHAVLPPEVRLLVTTGFLGGLTTFSTAAQGISVELDRDRQSRRRIAGDDDPGDPVDPRRIPLGERCMNGTILRFYVHENRTHRHVALFEWLLEQAKKIGIHGGSAFRAIAGFGRHGILHEEHFFELAADMTIEVEFVVTDAEAEKLLALLREERVSIFYARVPAEFGSIEGDR
jgi:protein CrcB